VQTRTTAARELTRATGLMYTRDMKVRRKRKWVDRQIDDALLAIAMQAGFIYAHRRARRVLPKVALGAVVATGVGAAAAVTVAGIGAVGAAGVAGGAAAWYRRSKRSAAELPEPAAPWRPSGVAAAPTASAGENAGGVSATAPASERSSGS
jgi:hypothetical protein